MIVSVEAKQPYDDCSFPGLSSKALPKHIVGYPGSRGFLCSVFVPGHGLGDDQAEKTSGRELSNFNSMTHCFYMT